MIEKYFVKGARFRWAAPGAVGNHPRDGAIMNNPHGLTADMTYIGMDGEVFDLGLGHVSQIGLTMNMRIPHLWLAYALGRTAKANTTSDVLTGFMSGCWIAVWSDQGGRWVGHVGTVDGAPKNLPPNSTVKNTFALAMPRNVTAYNPFTAWTPGDFASVAPKWKEAPTFKVLSLVTSTGQFYSVLMVCRVTSEPGIWVCAGKKLVPPTHYDALYLELITTRQRR